MARHSSLYCNGDVEQKTVANPLAVSHIAKRLTEIGEYLPAPTSALNAVLLITNQNRRAFLRVYAETTSDAS